MKKISWLNSYDFWNNLIESSNVSCVKSWCWLTINKGTHRTGDLSRVYPTSCPVSAGIGSSRPFNPQRVSGIDNGWMFPSIMSLISWIIHQLCCLSLSMELLSTGGIVSMKTEGQCIRWIVSDDHISMLKVLYVYKPGSVSHIIEDTLCKAWCKRSHNIFSRQDNVFIISIILCLPPLLFFKFLITLSGPNEREGRYIVLTQTCCN